MRSRALGLADEQTFALPITQAELGDATGLSTVHVNRVLQDLRRDELVTWRGQAIAVLDWERLCLAGDFDPAYLHLLNDSASERPARGAVRSRLLAVPYPITTTSFSPLVSVCNTTFRAERPLTATSWSI